MILMIMKCQTRDIDMIRTDRLDEKKYIIKVPVTVSDEEVASPEGVEN